MSETGSSGSEQHPRLIPEKPLPQEKISETLRSSAETLNLTNKIEQRAELDATEKQVEQIIEKGGLTGWFDKRKLKAGIAAGMFLLNLKVGDIFAGEKTVESQLTADEKQTVEIVTGTPFSELQQKFNIQIPVQPDKNGNYIIHIGQRHQPMEKEFRAGAQRMVIDSQMYLEDVVLKTVETNNLRCIFAEGVTSEETMIEIRNFIKNGKQDLDTLTEKPIENFHDFISALELFSIYDGQIDHSHIYHYLGTQLTKIREKLTEALKNGKIKERLEGEERELLKRFIHSSQVKFSLSGFGEEPNPYTVGIGFRALMNDKISYLCPAEDSAVNKRAVEAMKKRDEVENEITIKKKKVYDRLSPQYHQDLSTKIYEQLKNEETMEVIEREAKETVREIEKNLEEIIDKDQDIIEIKQRYNEAKGIEYKAVRTDREVEILKSIHRYDQKIQAKGEKPEHIALIYGDLHDLTPELQEWNANNPPDSIDRGLIKISPKE